MGRARRAVDRDRPAPARDDGLRLGIRLVVALAATVAMAIAADRVGSLLLPSDLRVAGGIGALAMAGLVGLALVRRAIAPLAAARADLHLRYQAALADALRDALTGLGNHRAFQEELDRQVESALRYETQLSLILLDFDDFKSVNDKHGHAAGDRALARFGGVVNGAIRRADRAFRVGGDEFAILLPHTDADGARVVARRLLAASLQPIVVGEGVSEPLSFSAGISGVPELASGRAQLLSQADAALYAAKRGGRTDVAVFDPEIEVTRSADQSGAAVADVIARGLLRPVYQPIIELQTGVVLGYEGLIRPVAPAPFTDPTSLFAAAEAGGRVTDLDLACVETLISGADDLPPDAFLSVNLSPQTIEAPEFSTAALLSILVRHGFPPERLVMELTEHQPIRDPDRVRLKVETSRRAGIRLAADDLGAGNAGLRLLSQLRFDVLKVDLSLVRRSAPGGPTSALISSVVEFAGRTGAMVVAEGIEHHEEVQQVAALGVQAGQGFLFGRPGPIPTRADPAAEPLGAMGPMVDWRQSVGLPTTAAAGHRP